MKNKSALNHLDLWKDICFYEVYMDMIEYEDYLIYLSNKYSIDIDDIVVKIDGK